MSLALHTHKHTWHERHATSEFTATTKGHTNEINFIFNYTIQCGTLIVFKQPALQTHWQFIMTTMQQYQRWQL